MAKNVPKIANISVFFAIFWTLTGSKTLQKHFFYLVEEVLSFDLVGHMWKSVKNWLQEWVLKTYKWKWGRSRWIAYFENYFQKQLGDRYGECPIAFPTKFPTRFPARISHNIFLQNFPKLDPDWLAPHHPIANAKFPPITAFLKLAFSPTPCPAKFSRKISCKNFPQHFPAKFSQAGSWLVGSPSPYSKCWISTNHCLSQIGFPLHPVSQDFPTRFCRKNFPQDFPKLDPDWLAPHHPISNAKFPPITAFLKLVFSPPPCHTRVSLKNFPQDFPARISHKNFPQNFLQHFPQNFPARFSCKNFLPHFLEKFPARFSHKIFPSWILIGWLPITLFQMLNFHQSLLC